MRGYRVCHRESGIAGRDARIAQIEHLGPNRYESGRVGHEKDLLIYVFPVVEQEFCQFPLVVWALSQDIFHPCSGQHWQPCMCLCANIR